VDLATKLLGSRAASDTEIQGVARILASRIPTKDLANIYKITAKIASESGEDFPAVDSKEFPQPESTNTQQYVSEHELSPDRAVADVALNESKPTRQLASKGTKKSPKRSVKTDCKPCATSASGHMAPNVIKGNPPVVPGKTTPAPSGDVIDGPVSDEALFLEDEFNSEADDDFDLTESGDVVEDMDESSRPEVEDSADSEELGVEEDEDADFVDEDASETGTDEMSESDLGDEEDMSDEFAEDSEDSEDSEDFELEDFELEDSELEDSELEDSELEDSELEDSELEDSEHDEDALDLDDMSDDDSEDLDTEHEFSMDDAEKLHMAGIVPTGSKSAGKIRAAKKTLEQKKTPTNWADAFIQPAEKRDANRKASAFRPSRVRKANVNRQVDNEFDAVFDVPEAYEDIERVFRY